MSSRWIQSLLGPGIATIIVLGALAAGGIFVEQSSTGTIPFASCENVAFSAPLQPVDPPADVHVYSKEPARTIDTSKLYRVTIETAKGNIVMCLQPDLAPTAVNVIVTLVRNGYYNGVIFHRVVEGFVIQGGDPTGTGRGGPGFTFADEPVRQDYVVGALAMANAGPNTNGSQFFICTANNFSLPPNYSLFGRVEEGMNVVYQIKQGDAMQKVYVQEQE